MATIVKVLNGLSVEHDGRECPAPPPKVRQLIAILIAHRGAPAGPEAMIDELWGEHPPKSAHATLQTYVYQLRKFIERHGLGGSGSGSEMLTTGPHGYLLEIPPEQVDAWRFGRLVRSGSGLLAKNDFDKAAVRLRQALDMGRGTALAGLPHGPVVEAYAVDLDEQHTHAHHMWIQAEMNCGRHGNLVNELRALTVRHPLDEGFHQFLIEALTRLGRRADALQAFQTLRTVLQDELGLDPSSTACSLQADLLHG